MATPSSAASPAPRALAAATALEADRSRLHQARLGELLYGLRSLQGSLEGGAPAGSKGAGRR